MLFRSPAIREVKNKICIDGHLNVALDEILKNNSPDAIFNVLGELAHRAIEMAFTAQHAMPTSIETLRGGFMTTESCGPDKLYQIKINYKSLEELHQAESELTTVLKRTMQYSVPVAKVKVMPGRERIVQKMACLEVMDDGALLYGDARGPFQASVAPLPKPLTWLRFQGDCGQFGGYEECSEKSEHAFPVYTNEHMRSFRDDRDHSPLAQSRAWLPVAPEAAAIKICGTVDHLDKLPPVADHTEGDTFQVAPPGDRSRLYRASAGNWVEVAEPLQLAMGSSPLGLIPPALSTRRYEGSVNTKEELPSPAFYSDGCFYNVLQGENPGEYTLDKGQWVHVVHPVTLLPVL